MSEYIITTLKCIALVALALFMVPSVGLLLYCGRIHNGYWF
jgi:hypothetical protein